MFARRLLTRSALLGGVLAIVLATAAHGEDFPGQEDLDKATLVKLSAKSMGDLETVVELCDSALSKGVDEENVKYARDLLTATLYEQAARLSRMVFDQPAVDPRWQRIRDLALKKLQRAVEVRPDLGDAHLLMGRFQALPGGDREAARTALNQAIPLLQDNKEQLSVAYQVRGTIAEQPETVVADLTQAIEINPRNLAAWRTRGVFYLGRNELEKAMDDFRKLLEIEPNDVATHQAMAQTLRAQKQFDQALEHLNKVIQADPESSLAYNLRAQIFEDQGNLDAAVENLNSAIKVQPRDLGALMMRARLRLGQEQFDLARSDVERVLQLRPGLPQAILLRSLISASQQQLGSAIGDLQQLLRQAPDNEDLKVQIGSYYEADKRPRKAIEIYTEVLTKNAENWFALRRRGDAFLSVGKHAEAIQDFEAALKLRDDDASLLNNFAWVLATSPDEKLRNGQRAVELAKKACELTEFKAPHIISTLAASHAELGQFEEAVNWSKKAAEIDKEEEQLAKELQSYVEHKAWRELQEVAENQDPLEIPEFEEPAKDPQSIPAEDAPGPDPAPLPTDAPDANRAPSTDPASPPDQPGSPPIDATDDPNIIEPKP